MSRIAYVNGQYVPHRAATVHIEDRGYQFADGVYEVIAVSGGHRVDEKFHFDRLERSLGELEIPAPVSRRVLAHIMDEVQRRNRVRNGMVYLQITRGVAPRDHGFPSHSQPAMVITARRMKPPGDNLTSRGVRVITIPDIRWKRNDIKSVSLLPNVMAKQRAREAGAYEAWQVDEKGMVTEGSSTNAWIVDGDGGVITRPLADDILAGITRLSVLSLARAAGIPVTERPFSVAEAKAAGEAFLTSTTAFVMPVTRIDDTVIGDGRPGPVTRMLLQSYQRHAGEEGGAGTAASA